MNETPKSQYRSRRSSVREWMRRENISIGLAAAVLFFIGGVIGLGLAFTTGNFENPFVNRWVWPESKNVSSASSLGVLPPEPLHGVHLDTMDERSPEDSRTMQLIGSTASGVTAVRIWSSCDDETHQMQNFKKGDKEFTYKISPTLGNLCRGQNDFVIRVFGKRDGKEVQLAEEFKQSVDSGVGLRKRADLQLLRFLETHTLPASRSIEDDAILPTRLLPGNAFALACNKNEIENVHFDPVMLHDTLGAEFKLSPQATTGSASVIEISWLEKSEDMMKASTLIPALSVGRCDRISGFELFATTSDRVIVDPIYSAAARMFFNGSEWINLKDRLSQTLPLSESDMGPTRLIVYKDTFGIVETIEVQSHRDGQALFPDQRGEYLFSMNDGAFLGVVWHRKR